LIASKIEALRLKESIDDVLYHAQHLHKQSGTKDVGRLLLLHQLQYYYLCFSAEGRCRRAVTVINYGLEGYFCLIAGLLNLKQVLMSSSLIFRISSFSEILNLRQRQGTAFLAIRFSFLEFNGPKIFFFNFQNLIFIIVGLFAVFSLLPLSKSSYI